jgi:outer membrane protein OmpA-like peptidoglycan-associated protein
MAVLACALASSAWADETNSDAPGGKDNHLVSRFKGSILYTYGDESLGAAKVVSVQNGKPVFQNVEGRISNRLYWAQKGASPLEIHRNYRQALAGAGFQIVYECEEQACKKDHMRQLMVNRPREVKLENSSVLATGIFDDGGDPGFHLVSARKKVGSGYVYVQVALARGDVSANRDRVQQFVEIVEPATAETGKVTVDAKDIGESLKRDGKIALYGVLFDTNKSVLREDSAEQLKQMADALKSTPSLKVFIVGHTDNQGELENNLNLSQRRAQAVAEALASKYGIPAARMSARGVANMAPVASNDDEAGRARNRRVELVVR